MGNLQGNKMLLGPNMKAIGTAAGGQGPKAIGSGGSGTYDYNSG